MIIGPLARALLLDAPAPYVGLVTTNNRIADRATDSNTQFMSRSAFVCCDDVSEVRVVIPNWWWDRQGDEAELGTDNVITYTAALEYPAGVFTQATFAGSASTTGLGMSNVVTDPISVRLPRGAIGWVRIYRVLVSGDMPYHDCPLNTEFGEGMVYGTSGIADLTLGGAVGATNANFRFGPIAIIGVTTRPSLGAIGDSRTRGVGDGYTAGSLDLGETCRSVGRAGIAYVNLGCGGDGIRQFVASHDMRAAIVNDYCTHGIIDHGANDMNDGRSGAQIIGDLQTTYGYFPTKTLFGTTISPWTTSSDGWATQAGQTVNSKNAARLAVNAFVRGAPAPLAGCFDVAFATEDGSTSKWKSPGYTTDGVHASQLGYEAILNAGVVRTHDIKMPAVLKVAPTIWDAATLAYLDRWTTGPTTAKGLAINSLISGLRAAGYWDGWDALWLMDQVAEQSSLLCVTDPAYDLDLVGSPVFVTGQGWRSNGAGHLDTQFDPATAAGHFSQDDACLWVDTRTAASSPGFLIGNSKAAISPSASTAFVVNANTGSNNTVATSANNETTGIFAWDRDSAANFRGRRRGVGGSAISRTSEALVSEPILIGTRDGVTYNAKVAGAAGIGASIGATGQATLWALFAAYKTASQQTP